MANIANAYDENAEAATGFDPVPFGDYRAKIVQAGIVDISRTVHYGRCLALTWQIETGPHDGRLVWQRLNLWPEGMTNLDKVMSIANSQFAAIREATGRLTPEDTDELLHIPCMIKVAIRTDPTGQYAPQNEVRSVRPVPAPSATPRPSAANSGASAPGRRPAPVMSRQMDDDIPF